MTSKIVSKDGTVIAFTTSGRGPPLVLVHGASADRTRWAALLPELEERRTVHAMDRRGRGDSGDAVPYAIEREFEDVAAVVDSIGKGVDLLGHSYGAICALEAALRTPSVRRLVLYEPPLPVGGILSEEMAERLGAMLAAGDREGVVTAFLADVVRLPPAELAALKALPSWRGRVAAAHTILREMRSSYVFHPERFESFRTPTLLLLGGESPPFFAKATEAIRAALPASRVVALPGQRHTAMNTAPELFLREVLGFLGG
jgi:pimeloyl-ACP methyl ester carboxylesterase